MKIRILQDFKASIDGFNLVEFKKDEILEGDTRLTPHFLKWAFDNKGFVEEIVEEKMLKQQIHNKAILNISENKSIDEKASSEPEIQKDPIEQEPNKEPLARKTKGKK